MRKFLSVLRTVLFVVVPIVVIVLAYRSAGLRRLDEFAAGAMDPAAFQYSIDLINRTLVTFEFDYFLYLRDHAHAAPATGGNVYAKQLEDGEYVSLLFEEYINLPIYVTDSGFYNLYVHYMVPADTLLPITISLFINGELPFRESRTLDLPLLFMDETKEYVLDRLGDEMLPPQIRIRDWRGQRLFDNNFTTYLPLMFYLEAGSHEITISNSVRNEILIRDVIFKPAIALPTHEEYIAAMVAKHGIPYDSGEPFITSITSNMYSYMVSTDLAVGSWNNPSFARFDPGSRLINFVFYYLFGSQVGFEVYVPQAGFYSVAFHYINTRNEVSNFHTVKINGEIPSAPFAAVEAQATGIGMGNMEVLDPATGQPLRVFLHEGINTISIKAVRGPFAPVINDLQRLLLHIGEFILDIRRITGNVVDRDRTWRLTRYLPHTEYFLDAYQVILEETINRLIPYTRSGLNSDVAATLMDAVAHLRLLREFPDELPLRLDMLAGEAGSVMDYIAYTLNLLMYHSFALSQVHVYNNVELPSPNISLFGQVASISHQVLLSYTSDRFRHQPEPDAVNVWVQLSPMHINVLQSMVDRDFTLNTGIDVRISLMPDVNRLILANASGETPDVAMGLSNAMVFNLASRNALYDLSRQPDFWQVATRFPPGSLVAYVFNDGVFAIPDQLNFNALVYRTDVFNALELESPDTWQDVIDILPELQRFGMDFFHPIAFAEAFKGFAHTVPLIYQHGGRLYSEDGLSAAIYTPETLAGIRFLSSLFTYHAMPVQVPSFFNSFRTALVPIGIVDASTYNLIRNGAPELAGLWNLAPKPGIENAYGEVIRYFVVDSGAGCIIFADSLHIDGAWQFISWWTSAGTQATFANTMQTFHGRQFMWFSSNLEALAQNPIDPADLEVILEQMQWLRTPPHSPGFYQLERSLSNIWNTIVFDGTPPRNAVDVAMPSISREFARKLRELNFIDAAGNSLRPYTVREVDWIVYMIERYGR